MGRRRALLALTVACACLLVFAAAAQAAEIIVTNTEDPAGAGTCPGTPCSLRQAVAAAKPGDTIKLPGDGYELTQGAQIVVNKALTIEGEGNAVTEISGFENLDSQKRLNRIMKVVGAALTVRGVDFVGGVDENDENPSSNVLSKHGGGGLFVEKGASAELFDDAFDLDGAETSGQPVGGGVANEGTLDMENVRFFANGGAFGSGLFGREGTINATNVSFWDNGILNVGGTGGSVYLDVGEAAFENTTIVGGGAPASIGGGIVNADAKLTLTNDTLSGNLRGSLETDTGGNTSVQNTILGSGFSDGSDFDCIAAGKPTSAGTTTAIAVTDDLGNNIDQDNKCGLEEPSDIVGEDPRLAPIFPNEGSVENIGLALTQALLSGSPAINAGEPAACPDADARGVIRPQGPTCDIGAFEAKLIHTPTAQTEKPTLVASTVAELSGTVNLEGEAGGGHFLWGTNPGDLSNETPVTAVGVQKEPTPVPGVLTGLTPATTYFYKAVADNASGSTPAGNVESFTTEQETSGGGGNEQPPLTPTIPSIVLPSTGVLGNTTKHALKIEDLPPPVLGKTVDIEPVSGTVLVALPEGVAASASAGRAHASISKGLKFIPISEARQIPVGSTFDTTRGVVKIATAGSTPGPLQFGNFGAGLFKLLQTRQQRGLSELNLINSRTPSQACATLGKRAIAAKHLSGKVLGRLNVDSKGKFTARGQYSASTVRGTVWSVSNQCNGTLTKVVRGVVSVRDLRKRKTITLFTGQSYLAKAPGV